MRLGLAKATLVDFGLDLDNGLIAGSGERLLLLAGPERLLGRDFRVVLGNLGLGDLLVQPRDQVVQLRHGRCLLLRRLPRGGKLDLALGKLRLLLLEQLIDAALLRGETVGRPFFGVALLANAVLQRDQTVKLLRQIIGLIFELGKDLRQQHGAAHHGEGVVPARDDRGRRRAADPLHGAQHLDDGFLSLGDRVANDGDLIGQLRELGLGLGKFCFARLHPRARFDQLGVELRPRLGQGDHVLGQTLLLRAARLQLLRGLVEFLLCLLAGEIVFRRSKIREGAQQPRE